MEEGEDEGRLAMGRVFVTTATNRDTSLESALNQDSLSVTIVNSVYLDCFVSFIYIIYNICL